MDEESELNFTGFADDALTVVGAASRLLLDLIAHLIFLPSWY